MFVIHYACAGALAFTVAAKVSRHDDTCNAVIVSYYQVGHHLTSGTRR
jgi:hypothetical protein